MSAQRSVLMSARCSRLERVNRIDQIGSDRKLCPKINLFPSAPSLILRFTHYIENQATASDWSHVSFACAIILPAQSNSPYHFVVHQVLSTRSLKGFERTLKSVEWCKGPAITWHPTAAVAASSSHGFIFFIMR